MAEACVNTSRLPIQCPVCLETYKRPRTLPCLHTFCSSCLHGHITNAAQNSNFSSFLCPVCRANTRAPKPYASRETWADQFPINHWIVSVIDEATTITPDDALYCDVHPDSKINLYCSDHEAVCCAMCIATAHRKCDHVEEIVNMLDSSDSEQVQKEVLIKVKQSEDILTDLDAKCALADSNLQIDKDKMTNIIEKEYNDALTHLDALKTTAIDKVEQNCRLITNEIRTRKLICNKGKQTCKQVKEMLEEKGKNKGPFSNFIQSHAAKLKMKSVDVCVANNWSFNEANSFKFEVDPQFINIKSIPLLGRVKDMRCSTTESNNTTTETNRLTVNRVDQSNRVDQVETERETRRTHDIEYSLQNIANQRSNPYNNSIMTTPIGRCSELQHVMYWNNPLFKKHWLSGLTFFHHELMMVCDQSEGSVCLIRDGTILYEDRRRTTPWDITEFTDTSVVVTYPQECIVRIFEIKCNVAVLKLFRRPSIIGRPVSVHRSFPTKDACFGVTSVSDRIFLACEDCIKVYTENGRCVQLLKLSHRVEPLFERVIGLTYDRRRSVLYAADEVSNKIFSFQLKDSQLSHQPNFVYKDSSLRCPRGLSIGTQGEIYVCGFVSKSIHILNTYGNCIGILSTEQRPCGICVEHKQSLVVVSFYPDTERKQDISNDVRFYKVMKRF
ncbi:tripartite motif-containing protein 5-like [Mercenaria mercenaria]|uniref:tripartite motif-containing protein 5-like n=1 Tax=Mercenaria mercenaria TaxID=6596 RepID=UPI00234F9CBD|nr:tripartite motif-containing protein 5-like [Mercenaria mercenaria]